MFTSTTRAALLAALLPPALAACTSTSSSGPAPTTAPIAQQAPSQFEIIPLRFASAHELAKLLHDVIENRAVRIEADGRTNSLVLAGANVDIERVKALIARLDIEVPAKR